MDYTDSRLKYPATDINEAGLQKVKDAVIPYIAMRCT